MKSYKRRYQSATKKHLLYALAVALLAALTTGVVQNSVQAKEVIQNGETYVMTKGSKNLSEGAARQASDAIKAKFYLGEAAYGDNPKDEAKSPILWDILGPANTSTSGTFNFSDDEGYSKTSGFTRWGVYPSSEESATALSDQILAISENVTEKSQFNPNTSVGNVYYAPNTTTEGKTSTLYRAIDKAFTGYFDGGEQAFIGYTSKADAEYQGTNLKYSASTDKPSKETGGNPADILYNARLFPLSAKEAETYYSSDTQRIASGADDYWWLRSAISGNSYDAGVVRDSGYVYAFNVDYTSGVRAAFNSNLDAVSYTTLAGQKYVLPAYTTGTANLTSMTTKDTPQVPAYRLTLLSTALNNCVPKSTSPIKAAAGSTGHTGIRRSSSRRKCIR